MTVREKARLDIRTDPFGIDRFISMILTTIE